MDTDSRAALARLALEMRTEHIARIHDADTHRDDHEEDPR